MIRACRQLSQIALAVIGNLPSQVPLKMSANTSPEFTGICYVRDGNLMFSFGKPIGAGAICHASCRFVDTGNAVDFASTPLQGATADNKTEEFALRGEGKNVASALKAR
jgi:hypothetical protein